IHEVRPPFSPEQVVKEFAGYLRSYGISEVEGDRYGGEWPREVFSKAGIHYKPAERSKSELYGSLLPLLTSGRVELLDHLRLTNQLLALERKTTRVGKDSIDHPPHGHDDIANAAAGALVRACQVGEDYIASWNPPRGGTYRSEVVGRVLPVKGWLDDI